MYLLLVSLFVSNALDIQPLSVGFGDHILEDLSMSTDFEIRSRLQSSRRLQNSNNKKQNLSHSSSSSFSEQFFSFHEYNQLLRHGYDGFADQDYSMFIDLLAQKKSYASQLSTDSDSFCGISHDFIQNYLEPPAAVKEFLTFAFGVTFGIGPLTEPQSESCQHLSESIGKDLEMAYVELKKADPLKMVANKTISNDANYKKCIDRGDSEDDCANGKLAQPVSGYAQTYLSIPFPICMAVRPCDKNNENILKESTFGIRIGGDGLEILKPILSASANPAIQKIEFGLLELSYSSTGDLIFPVNEELPALLEVSETPDNIGMQVYLEAKIAFPIEAADGKEVIKIEAECGLGTMGMLYLSDGSQIKSAAQLLAFFMEHGSNINKIADSAATRADRTVDSLRFQLDSKINGGIELNVDNLLGTKNMPSLNIEVHSRAFIDVVVDLPWSKKSDTHLSLWLSFTQLLDLSKLVNGVPVLSKIIPQVMISTTCQFYINIHETKGLDVVVAYAARLQLKCGEVKEQIGTWNDWLQDHKEFLEGIGKLGDLIDLIDEANDFLDGICNGDKEVGFQVRYKHNVGIVPEDTLIRYQSSEGEKSLKLSDLPVCDTEGDGVKPSPYKLEEAHQHSVGRCSTNLDCRADDDSYKTKDYAGKQGYCLMDPELNTALGCNGRCIKKLDIGELCSNSRLNYNLGFIDNLHRDHTVCGSGMCICEHCTNQDHYVPNGFPCSTRLQCASGWCEGDDITNCKGVCRAQRENGVAAWKGWSYSCKSTRVECGTCVAGLGDLADGKACSTFTQCASGWCEGDNILNCKGVCRPQQPNGSPAWKSWSNSCQSGRQKCGTCSANWQDLPNGAKCDTFLSCASGWCEGDVIIGCKGTCQARRRNGVPAWKGWSNSCESKRVRCGICTDGGDIPNGNKCTMSNDCVSGWCEGTVTTGCQGTCQPKRDNGYEAWNGWRDSCKSGDVQCGTCTNGKDLAAGKRCTWDEDCRSGDCRGWITVNCNGVCT